MFEEIISCTVCLNLRLLREVSFSAFLIRSASVNVSKRGDFEFKSHGVRRRLDFFSSKISPVDQVFLLAGIRIFGIL